MKKTISAKQKIGRPATGVTPMMGFRADPETRAAVVRWAEKQPDMPSLSEAIRRLVHLGLSTTPKAISAKVKDRPSMLYPTPTLPDRTPIEQVQLSARIQNALNAAGIKSVGEVREASDATLLSLVDLGRGSIAQLREKLGLKAKGK